MNSRESKDISGGLTCEAGIKKSCVKQMNSAQEYIVRNLPELLQVNCFNVDSSVLGLLTDVISSFLAVRCEFPVYVFM